MPPPSPSAAFDSGTDDPGTPAWLRRGEVPLDGGRSRALSSVYDPFAGSGTTLIAAERLGRRCHAMEIDPRYVQVAIERWQNFTGKTAERADG